jgi:hypothetical protein
MLLFNTFITLLSLLTALTGAARLPNTVRNQHEINSNEDVKNLVKRETRDSFCANSVKTVDVRDLLHYLEPICDATKSEGEMESIRNNIEKVSKLYDSFLPERKYLQQQIRIEKCNCGDETATDVQKFSCVQKYTEITIKMKGKEKKTFSYPSFCSTVINF